MSSNTAAPAASGHRRRHGSLPDCVLNSTPQSPKSSSPPKISSSSASPSVAGERPFWRTATTSSTGPAAAGPTRHARRLP
uniref:Uncharacterized protein n=1 Tax=Setaria italica TaxID=4555 RepID=K3ZYN1_SETIT